MAVDPSVGLWSAAPIRGAVAGAQFALVSGALVLAGLGAVCIATIVGFSTALLAAMTLVVLGGFVGAAVGFGSGALGARRTPDAPDDPLPG